MDTCGHTYKRTYCIRKDSYLNYFLQNLLPQLIFTIAEKTVGVDIVGVSIHFHVHVVRTPEVFWDGKGDLR